MELPRGTVTFLFTDIQGSTQLWQQFPNAMPHALARHHTLLRQAIEDQGGYVFQIIGDAFCAAFHTALDGLRAAIVAQRRLGDEEWGETGTIRVRMAIHSGAAEVRSGEYTSGEYVSGLTLSRAARLLSAGHGGQVLLSQPTHSLLVYELPEGVDLRDLGEHRLKDLQRPERIYQLIIQDLPDNFPPLKTLTTLPNNLPIQLTSFIGREKETAAIVRMLSPGTADHGPSSPVRLITLVGTGGTGKTRLSVQVGSELLEAFSDGVWLVELAPLNDPSLVVHAVAAVVGVKEKPTQTLTAALVEHLRQKTLLLILDNCEHLVEACASLAAELLRSCPGLSILSNSREGLGVPGEVVYAVPALSVPDEGDPVLDLDQLQGYGSFRLFVDRAQGVQPHLQLTQEHARAIVQICSELDGIPLAIEMAAARTKMLSPAQIAGRLNDRFRLLAGGDRLAPARQQTLHALIDWSYNLLDEAERVLLRRLSVFAGGWTLEAAEAVCSGDAAGSNTVLFSPPEIARYDVIDLLNQLVNKSLVVVDFAQSGDNRYGFLESIRHYAWEKLAAAGELEIVRDRQLYFFLNLAMTAEQFLEGAEQATWMDSLEKETDNIRATLSWSCHPDRVEAGLHLAEALKVYWNTRGMFSEGRDWLERLLALADNPTRLRAKALDQAGFLTRYQCDFQAAREFIAESLVIWRALGDQKGLADSLANLGYVTLFQGDLVSAQALYQESLQINRHLGNQQGIADALSHLGMIAFYEGNLDQANLFHSESLAIWRKLGDVTGLSHALNRLASVAFQAGRTDEARRLALESLRTALDLKYSEGIAWTMEILAAYAAANNRPQEALFLETIFERYRQAMGLPASPAQHQLLNSWLGPAHTALPRDEVERIQAAGLKVQAEQIASRLLDDRPLPIPDGN